MSNQYGSFQNDDVLANSVRAIKLYIVNKEKEVNGYVEFKKKDKKEQFSESDKAHSKGYLQALKDFEVFIKNLYV